MKQIKIIQVTTPMFYYKDVKYWVDERRYMDFNQFQDYIDKMTEKGATHLFIYNTTNTNSDDTPIATYEEDISDIWIRCKFVVIE